jgi:hypothetical protein
MKLGAMRQADHEIREQKLEAREEKLLRGEGDLND